MRFSYLPRLHQACSQAFSQAFLAPTSHMTRTCPHAWQTYLWFHHPVHTRSRSRTSFGHSWLPTHPRSHLVILLYYAQAIDPMLLTSLGTLATQEAQGTQATMEANTTPQLLHHHPDVSICYHASNMVGTQWCPISLSPKSQSCAAGYCLSSQPHSLPAATDPTLPDTDPIHVLCQIVHQVIATVTETKLGALFINTQTACPMCLVLDKLGHPQSATPLHTDNLFKV